ncbi:ABC transporter permease [Nocardioides mesophilus]|uniref:Transport permease protein n=2 Tax=Nocardioides mesophilus TaxID=433659 RepID=A0A7G9RHQ3_9ACTN|nr:ABC transporter permease [Nocardioides mesophilus]
MVARQADYWVTAYRRTWRGSVFTSFVTPLFYVVAMGVLLGRYIDPARADLQGAPSYLAYIAPGLVAAHVMQIATGEVTWPVLGKIKWDRTYLGMVATPLRISDIVAAHLLFVLFRVATTSAAFLVVLAFFDVFASPAGALGAFAATLLVGMAFATPLYGVSAGLKDQSAFAVIYRVMIVPLFLFSGAFFPISNLPAPLEAVAVVTPLWHGVDLTRMLTLGTLEPGPALVHLAYLGTLTALGWWWSVRRLSRRLVH